MDSRGPSEGAPGDSLEMSIMDKCSEFSENWHASNLLASALGDQSRKSNNRLLFLTVEYVEEQSRDYSRMFPAYEQVTFSPRAASPLSDFHHRVSPHDPNMSSAARYSPTPVPLPPLPFHNSTAVLQGPPSPLVVQSETATSTPASINFTAVRATNETVGRAEVVADFSNPANDEELVSGVDGELILMQGATSELEASATPLMLTGISGAEFALTRDFLVMHDDQINVIGSLRNRDTSEELAVVAGETIDAELNDNEISLPVPVIEIMPNNDGGPMKIEPQAIVETDTRIVRRSRRQINDKKTFSCDRCESVCHKSGECAPNDVRTIADQPVPSRAIATLPGAYLSIDKLTGSSGISADRTNFGVFAKRNIRSRTQFGPIEGILCPYYGVTLENSLPLLYETENGEFFKIDVSNENASNWMRFVRPATTYKEQNLVICQQGDGIVFLTTRNILPKEELKAGPNPDYAIRRNLTFLEPETKDDKELSDSKAWPCFECNQRFSTSEKLRKHLTIHDNPKSEKKSRMKRRKIAVPTNKLFKVMDGQTSLYACPHCPKIFPRSYSLKRHLLIHPGAKSAPSRYDCPSRDENFLSPHNRNRRAKIFHADDKTEKENSRRRSTVWKCNLCNLIFGKSTLRDIHVFAHTSNAIDAVENFHKNCPQCNEEFVKREDLINHVAKHGRYQLRKTTKIGQPASHRCAMCYKRFATKVRLQQHYLVHGDEDQKPLPCEICFKRFMNNSALSCHLKTHREDKQIFECPMCRQLFDQVLMLRDHIETHRSENETFTCPQCPRTFVKYSVIRKHIRAHHCERKHKCQFCAKPFPTVDKLRMHLLRHSDHRQFHCANCEKKFKRKDKLKEHMMRMHNSQRVKNDQTAQNNQMKKFVPKVNPTDYNRFVYKCHQCLVGFKRRGMLVNHLAKRHPDVAPESVPELNLPILRQTRDYYCQYCEKVYKSSSKRKAHIVKNHPGAALPASNRRKDADLPGLPNSTFSQTVGSVTTTPQGCQWCHKQYASKAKLLQHQRKKHSTLMEPADKVPRARNRSMRNSSDEISNNANFLMTDYLEGCAIVDDFAKPKIIKITPGIDLIGNDLGLAGQQQFSRIRDIR